MGSKKAAAAVRKPKRQSNVVSLEKKREIIAKIGQGMTVSDVARKYNLPRTTVSTYWNHRQEIIEANVLPIMSRTVSEKKRPLAVNEMEVLLLLWMQEKKRTGDRVTDSMMCEKAKKIYSNLTKDDKEKVDFRASPGWFYRFKIRHGLHSVVRYGEVASVDKKATEEYVQEYGEFIKAERFASSQIFNCAETSLFWKKMPKRTVQEATLLGHKPVEGRLTLLFCANARGDFKLKPLLVYHSENPRAFKQFRVCKDALPVMWRSNAKARVTRVLFLEWIRKIFAVTVKKYLERKELPVRCVLLLNNALAHAPDLTAELEAEFPWITVKFLPTNITSLLQPMDQLVMANFKKLYTKHMFRRCSDITHSTDITLRDFWKNFYNIYQAVLLIDKAWSEVTERTLKSAWRKLLPSAASEQEEKQEEATVMRDILDICKDLQIEANADDVQELVDSHQDDLTAEDLRLLLDENQRAGRGEISNPDNEGEEEEDPQAISTQVLKDSLRKWAELEEVIQKYHPNKFSAYSVISNMNDSIMPFFHSLLRNRKKQVAVDRFFKSENEEPQPGPSGV